MDDAAILVKYEACIPPRDAIVDHIGCHSISRATWTSAIVAVGHGGGRSAALDAGLVTKGGAAWRCILNRIESRSPAWCYRAQHNLQAPLVGPHALVLAGR